MTINRLAKSEAPPTLTAQEICDEGNARLRGEIPYKNGEYHARHDVCWFIENGRPKLGWKPRQ